MNGGCMWVPGAVYTSSYFYKNRNKKDLAWKNVSEEVGQSVVNFTCE